MASQGDADPGRRRPVGEADLAPVDGRIIVTEPEHAFMEH